MKGERTVVGRSGGIVRFDQPLKIANFWDLGM